MYRSSLKPRSLFQCCFRKVQGPKRSLEASYLHPKGLHSGGHLSSNSAQAKNSQCLSVQLCPHELQPDRQKAKAPKSGPSQAWELSPNGRGKATAHLLPVPSAIFHGSRRLGNLPGRRQQVQWITLNMAPGQRSIATICQSFSLEPHSLTRGMGDQVQGHCV